MKRTPSDADTVDLTGYRVLVGVCGGIAAYKVCEVVSSLAQRGAEVSKALKGKEVWSQRDDNEVRRDQGSTIDCTKIWPKVDENDIRTMILTCPLGDAPEGGGDTEGAFITVHALWPHLGQLILEGGERHVP